ncbi:MAG: hypothetical protein ABJG88_09490 [Litorimonas sp.]
MMKKSVLIGVTLAAMALPNVAFAHCGGQTKGSFNVSCEAGVQVYRHQSLQLPRLSPNAQARVEVAKINRRTQQDAIASRERIAARNTAVNNRRAATDEFFRRSLVEQPSNLSRLSGFNFNRNFNSGFGFAGRRNSFGLRY